MISSVVLSLSAQQLSQPLVAAGLVMVGARLAWAASLSLAEATVSVGDAAAEGATSNPMAPRAHKNTQDESEKTSPPSKAPEPASQGQATESPTSPIMIGSTEEEQVGSETNAAEALEEAILEGEA